MVMIHILGSSLSCLSLIVDLNGSPITDDDFDSLRVLDCDSNEIEDMEQAAASWEKLGGAICLA